MDVTLGSSILILFIRSHRLIVDPILTHAFSNHPLEIL